MRRLIALLVLLAFVAATAAPAIAACRMRAEQKECCCEPAPANAICAPDCCSRVKAASPIAGLTHFRGLLTVHAAVSKWSSFAVFASRAPTPAARSLVALHERAAPRLPLRI